MKYLLFFALLTSACGSSNSFLKPGDYRVSSFFVRDDFLGQAGKESATIWSIEGKNNKYTITIMGGTKDATGSVDGEHLFIYKEETMECGGKVIYAATITPHGDDNDQFTGTANLTIDLCLLDSPETLFVEAHLVGEREYK